MPRRRRLSNGIAVPIASTQVKDFFGLRIEQVPGEFLTRMEALLHHFPMLSLTSTLLALSAVMVIVLSTKFLKRLPGSIVALVLGTLAVVAVPLPVATIGSHFGGIPSILCGARPQPAKLMRQGQFSQHVGRENLCPNIDVALQRAKLLIAV